MAQFANVDLSNRDLSKTTFSNIVTFDDKDYETARSYATLIENSNLSGSNLSNLNLIGMLFENVDLSYADLSNSNLSGVVFFNVNLSNTNLNGTILDNALLENVTLDCLNHPICN